MLARRDIDQLLIPFKAFKEHFGGNATGVLTAIVAPRMDGTAPVIQVSISVEMSLQDYSCCTQSATSNWEMWQCCTASIMSMRTPRQGSGVANSGPLTCRSRC